MINTQSVLYKLPQRFQNAIHEYKMEFPDTSKVNYKDIVAYRMITRYLDDSLELNIEDFRSQAEQKWCGKPVKKFIENDIEYYSCSMFDDVSILKIILGLPKKNKKIICGIIYDSYGIINRDGNHIHLWRYDNVDPSKSFSIVEE